MRELQTSGFGESIEKDSHGPEMFSAYKMFRGETRIGRNNLTSTRHYHIKKASWRMTQSDPRPTSLFQKKK